jgi:multiple sugar transport system permease protein
MTHRGRRVAWGGEASNALILAFLLAPLAALLLGALQTERDLFSHPAALWPARITWDNFTGLILGKEMPGLPPQSQGFPHTFLNSAIVAGSVTAITLVLASLAAYAVTRLGIRGSRTMAYGVLGTRVVPVIILIIPLYVTLRRLHLLDSLPGVILTEAGFFLPYAIWIMMAFFASLPRELEDAARIDGCTRLRAFWRVIVPLSAPGLSACGVIMFLISWNELFLPLILTSTPHAMTLPVLISSFVTQRFLSYSLLNAAGILAILPTLVLVVALQKFVVRGLIVGALKG